MFVIFGIIFVNLPSKIFKNYDKTSASKIIAFSFWFSFLLLHALYGGALKMFFSTEITIPFNDIRDVLKAFPSWNLIFADGNDVHFTPWVIRVSFNFIPISRNSLQGFLFKNSIIMQAKKFVWFL